MQEIKVVAAGSIGSVIQNKALIREIRGTPWQKIDTRFFIIMLLSITLHSLFIFRVNTMKLRAVEAVDIKEIPKRFVKLIVDKPIIKEKPKEKISDQTTAGDKIEEGIKTEAEKITPKTAREKKAIDRKAARKRVASRAAKVEKKIRTVGVLGMLTGVGSTAKGSSVIDVLGSTNRKKERFQDLEKALEDMSGLKQTGDIKMMDRKLVRSKDVSVSHREKIEDLVASIGSAKSTTFAKKGNFIIQRPESIEGSASSNVKRDNSAINKVVTSHKISIRMSYEKYLKRIPDLAGKVTVRFTILASGKITNVQILENTTENSDLERDIIRKVKMWHFEEIAEGKVTVTYPFVFRPS